MSDTIDLSLLEQIDQSLANEKDDGNYKYSVELFNRGEISLEDFENIKEYAIKFNKYANLYNEIVFRYPEYKLKPFELIKI